MLLRVEQDEFDRPSMTLMSQTNSAREGWILPTDLSGFIGKKTLVKLILEAIECLPAQTSGGGADAAGNPEHQSAMMLTLLTYCYATGVYSSTDIELGMQHDQMIRYLCSKSHVSSAVLLEFRRYGRHRIKHCLATVLQHVWELRFRDEDADPMRDAPFPGLSLGRRLNRRPTPDFAAEAEQRIARAVRTDSMAMDW
jgi:transposase